MYRNVRQVGFVPVLQSFGPSPLEQWEMKVENGFIRRVTDEHVRALALELSSTNVSTCFVRCPSHPRASLGIFMRHLVLVIKNMNKYFTFEITILDDRNVHRRFRFSNFEKRVHVQHFSTSAPLCLKPGWNEMYFDLADITCKSYKSNYVETTRLQIHANCRIRVIYFCDSMYPPQDVPQKLKMFFPLDHVVRKMSKGEIEVKQKESILYADYEDEYAEGVEGENMYFESSLKSAILIEAAGESKAPSEIEGQKSLIVTVPHGDYEDEYLGVGYYDDADYQDDGMIEQKIEEVKEIPEEVKEEREIGGEEDVQEEIVKGEEHVGDEGKANEG